MGLHKRTQAQGLSTPAIRSQPEVIKQTSLKMAREVEGKPRDTLILSKSLSVQ